MQNLIQIQDELRSMPMQAVMAYANGQNPQVPPYIALAEMNRRKQMQQGAQQQQQGPQGTIKDRVEQEAGLMHLQQQRQQQAMQAVQGAAMNSAEANPDGGGIAALQGGAGMPQAKAMKAGGITSMASGGTADIDGVTFETDPNDPDRVLWKGMSVPRSMAEYSLRSDRRRMEEGAPNAMRPLDYHPTADSAPKQTPLPPGARQDAEGHFLTSDGRRAIDLIPGAEPLPPVPGTTAGAPTGPVPPAPTKTGPAPLPTDGIGTGSSQSLSLSTRGVGVGVGAPKLDASLGQLPFQNVQEPTRGNVSDQLKDYEGIMGPYLKRAQDAQDAQIQLLRDQQAKRDAGASDAMLRGFFRSGMSGGTGRGWDAFANATRGAQDVSAEQLRLSEDSAKEIAAMQAANATADEQRMGNVYKQGIESLDKQYTTKGGIYGHQIGARAAVQDALIKADASLKGAALSASAHLAAAEKSLQHGDKQEAYHMVTAGINAAAKELADIEKDAANLTSMRPEEQNRIKAARENALAQLHRFQNFAATRLGMPIAASAGTSEQDRIEAAYAAKLKASRGGN